jgi:hypothetical protein
MALYTRHGEHFSRRVWGLSIDFFFLNRAHPSVTMLQHAPPESVFKCFAPALWDECLRDVEVKVAVAPVMFVMVEPGAEPRNAWGMRGGLAV